MSPPLPRSIHWPHPHPGSYKTAVSPHPRLSSSLAFEHLIPLCADPLELLCSVAIRCPSALNAVDEAGTSGTTPSLCPQLHIPLMFQGSYLAHTQGKKHQTNL